jgi:hypothetical protein
MQKQKKMTKDEKRSEVVCILASLRKSNSETCKLYNVDFKKPNTEVPVFEFKDEEWQFLHKL